MEKRHINFLMLCKTLSLIMVITALFAIFPLHLLPCFLTGFLVYEILLGLTLLVERFITGQVARWISITLLIILLVFMLSLGIQKLIQFLIHDFHNLADCYTAVSQLLQDAQRTLSPLITNYLPLDMKELQQTLLIWLNSNLTMKTFGHSTAHTAATMLIGMVLGAMISLRKESTDRLKTPLKYAILDRLHILSEAFHNVIFAQINVSIVNTLLTGCFLFGILPLFVPPFPFSKTIIVLTFFTGLLPIIGNLISNTVIVLIGLSISLQAALISLIYLIFIHKLEYFMNARIFSSCINAKTWEILLAMLVFQCAFGLSGVIAAPIYYAYIKAELRGAGLV
ncbi:AI-2E transporter family protein [Candidatus Erwinia haradaeae]|uniref:AI-2E transporter family protein n=1 Tax=Candidatus Erwinia haradaeae TaxID=1922217 RepID=A0A451DC31_9GAMM|nr:AI-2E family transporter [Candidatus Erwinia haradaeae]VFP83929.1 AI-2E transporter family protein [Candidatus Erwinia haradaeae]